MKKTRKLRPGLFWLFELILAAVMTLGVSLAGAKLMLAQVVPEEKVQLLACIGTGIVSFLISMLTALRTSQKKFLWALLTAGLYLAGLLLSNLLFFGEGFGQILPNIAAILGGGILGALLGAGKRRKIA